jgi:hypothetical protein
MQQQQRQQQNDGQQKPNPFDSFDAFSQLK